MTKLRNGTALSFGVSIKSEGQTKTLQRNPFWPRLIDEWLGRPSHASFTLRESPAFTMLPGLYVTAYWWNGR